MGMGWPRGRAERRVEGAERLGMGKGVRQGGMVIGEGV